MESDIKYDLLGRAIPSDKIAGAIRDSFCDFGGHDNVVTGLMAIAQAITLLADALRDTNPPPPGGPQ